MKRPRKMVYIAASIVLAAGIGLAAPVLWQQVNGPAAPDNPGDRQVITDTSPVISTGSVTIPKMELPDMNSGAAMDMIGLVVYQAISTPKQQPVSKQLMPPRCAAASLDRQQAVSMSGAEKISISNWHPLSVRRIFML